MLPVGNGTSRFPIGSVPVSFKPIILRMTGNQYLGYSCTCFPSCTLREKGKSFSDDFGSFQKGSSISTAQIFYFSFFFRDTDFTVVLTAKIRRTCKQYGVDGLSSSTANPPARLPKVEDCALAEIMLP